VIKRCWWCGSTRWSNA